MYYLVNIQSLRYYLVNFRRGRLKYLLSGEHTKIRSVQLEYYLVNIKSLKYYLVNFQSLEGDD